VASGAGPQAGLYGAAIVGLVAALFGGSRVLISEPTGPMTVVMTAVITTLIATEPEQGLAMAFAVVLVAGLTQVGLGASGLGRYIRLMPYSVISGFMSGIGIMLILLQLYPLFGVPSPPGGALGAFTAIPQLVANLRWWEFGLGGVALLVLFGMPASWRQRFPPHLIALAIGTIVSVTLLGGMELRRVGEIPMGLPEVAFPRFSTAQLSLILMEGMVLGLLGSIDTLLTAMISDSLTRREHDSNRELVGQGIANMTASFFGGLPGAGATMGTVVNIQVGARSPVAAIVRALILVLIILALAPLLESVPLAVLAAIAIKVGYDILDWSFLKRAHAVYMPAAVIMYGVMAMTVFVDLIAAVALGVFVANFLMIERLAEMQSKKVKLLDTSDMEFPLPAEERALFERGRRPDRPAAPQRPHDLRGREGHLPAAPRPRGCARVHPRPDRRPPRLRDGRAGARERGAGGSRGTVGGVRVYWSSPRSAASWSVCRTSVATVYHHCDTRLEALQRAVEEL
jgi:sulfate permease, SulP family